ncbi:hypothetical protein T01_7511 [Trichinella spiralis]|uniref:Uncharacterized protein n=1 Tax=Trichinella spiralis TaxID=6334 RepID=A0A0V1BJM1_TRISP|nr:hypothetical protein T01_7511 [Trichinella spiralis]
MLPPFGSDGDRTRDLRFTRPTPYHLATEPLINFFPSKGVGVEATVGLANGQLTERRRYGRSRHSKAGLPAGAPGDHVT